MAKRVFISFDYDNDVDLKNGLVGQAKLPDSPFVIEDWSVKDASPGWKADALARIKRSDLVIVICGEYMATATGVDEEIRLAREAGKDVILLSGRGEDSARPKEGSGKKLYKWTWDNLKALIGGAR